MKPSVYIESTVISYVTAFQSRDIVIAAHQQITLEWWNSIMPRITPFISQIVIDEISRGDTGAARLRLNAVKNFSSLAMQPEVADLADEYFRAIAIPQSKKADAYHLAMAAFHGMEYLVTWNCTHIAGARTRMIVEGINEIKDIATPVICTPEELMEV